MPSTTRPQVPDLAHRRMAIGLLVSLLVHAVILSVHFGIPGMRAGGASPISVTLAPLPPLPPLAPPVATLPPLPDPPSLALDTAPRGATPPSELGQAAPLPASAPPAHSGLRLFDPLPKAPPPAPVAARTRPVSRRRRAPRAPAASAPESTVAVIAQQDNPEASFKVPLEGPVPAAPEPEVAQAEPEAADDVVDDADERALAPERERLAEEEARLAAERIAQEDAARGRHWSARDWLNSNGKRPSARASRLRSTPRRNSNANRSRPGWPSRRGRPQPSVSA
ncbi:hypothetical protein [Massilia sp. Se16.2.3]|uniref:hypothetical protein n=1 Tax=Massilia sp. Se16.2.3 TaxID=2709303 RepID=UPI00160290EC|nr:hypothetical protein [Massilia sp. Se16.2.3]QNA99639.1 hypothetical protein G4G31_13630 [Massilia sp. Se16.2.3]